MSLELEHEILGALIMSPGLLEGVDLTAADFSDGRERIVFQEIAELWETERVPEIPVSLLLEKIPGSERESAAFVTSLISGNYVHSAASFELLARRLRDRRLSAELVRSAQALGEEHLRTGAFNEDGLRRLTALIEQRQEGRGGVNVPDQLMTGTALQALQIEAVYTVEKLVPCRSITLLHSPGGLGKTWFAFGMANAVSRGEPFLGLATKQRPVCYIDFENPLPLLIERARKLDIQDVRFWHLSAGVPPPKLDTATYKLYRQLPAESLIIFDTLRAAHDGDENSSQDMALIMGRLKELRELGFDIFLIHHTGKANERQYKGSTAISDLADHVIKLYRSRPGSFEEIQDEDEPDPDGTFVLCTGKTRFEPFHLYLSFNPAAGGFCLAEDPKLEALEAIAGYIAGPGRGQKQGEIIAWAKGEGVGPTMRSGFLALLNRGEREGRWSSHRGFKGARLYEPSCP
jgi:hypothetical protein